MRGSKCPREPQRQSCCRGWSSVDTTGSCCDDKGRRQIYLRYSVKMENWVTRCRNSFFCSLCLRHELTYNVTISKLTWAVSKGQQIATYAFSHCAVSSPSVKLIPADRKKWTEEVGVFLKGICLASAISNLKWFGFCVPVVPDSINYSSI